MSARWCAARAAARRSSSPSITNDARRMVIAATIVAMLALMAAGVHVAVAMALAGAFLALVSVGVPVAVIAQNAFTSVDSYALVAIPFFIWAGDLMMRGRIAAIIVDLIGSLVRPVRGGLALTVLAACVFFAAVNGSSVATTAAVGASSVDNLRRENYPPRFAAALAAVGGTLGVMIPPSLSFIIIGSVIGIPIDKLFLAGITPGLMEAALLMATAYYISAKHGYGNQTKDLDLAGFGRQLGPALPALAMPVIILGSIYGGIFTPTEVSAVAAAYAMAICLFVYRSITLGGIWEAGRTTVMQSCMIYLVIVGGNLLSFMLARLGVSADIAAFFRDSGVGKYEFLLLVNILLLILGGPLEGISMIVLTAPVIFPVGMALGVDPIHLAVIYVANVEIATLTPPIGLNLFVMAGIARLPVGEVVRGVTPFWLARLVALTLITYVPAISLWLVR
jgi:C4-dicarboxylate transporter, DctM subunit